MNDAMRRPQRLESDGPGYAPLTGASTRRDWSVLSSAMVALQLQWAVEYVFLTPSLLRAGLSPAAASLAWLPSPILQILLNPWLGRWSDSIPSPSIYHLNDSSPGGGGIRDGMEEDDRDTSPSSSLVGRLGDRRRDIYPHSGSFCWSSSTRRHPFLVATAAISSALLVFIALSGAITSEGGAAGGGGDGNLAHALLLAASFVLLDACNSINESFQRSLFTDVADLASEEGPSAAEASRILGHSYLGGAAGLGSAAGYLLAGIDLQSAFGRISAVTVLFLGGAAIFVLAQAIMLFWSARMVRSSEGAGAEREEESLQLSNNGAVFEANQILECACADETDLHTVPGGNSGPGKALGSCNGQGVFPQDLSTPRSSANSSLPSQCSWIKDLWRSPQAFKLLCLQQLLSWMCLWPVWLFATAYFGASVYDGDPNAPAGSKGQHNYDGGIRAGSLALASLGLSSATVAATILPWLSHRVGMRETYVMMQGVGSVAILTLYIVQEPMWSHVLIATAGLSWAANNSVPYAVIPTVCIESCDNGNSESNDGIALYTNVMYIIQTLPQLLGALLLGPAVEAFGGDYAVAMAIAGGCGLAGAVLGIAWIPRGNSSSSA